MTRKEASKFAEILSAYSRGETIQMNTTGQWRDCIWEEMRFQAEPDEYRIKPKGPREFWLVGNCRNTVPYSVYFNKPELRESMEIIHVREVI